MYDKPIYDNDPWFFIFYYFCCLQGLSTEFCNLHGLLTFHFSGILSKTSLNSLLITISSCWKLESFYFHFCYKFSCYFLNSFCWFSRILSSKFYSILYAVLLFLLCFWLLSISSFLFFCFFFCFSRLSSLLFWLATFLAIRYYYINLSSCVLLAVLLKIIDMPYLILNFIINTFANWITS